MIPVMGIPFIDEGCTAQVRVTRHYADVKTPGNPDITDISCTDTLTDDLIYIDSRADTSFKEDKIAFYKSTGATRKEIKHKMKNVPLFSLDDIDETIDISHDIDDLHKYLEAEAELENDPGFHFVTSKQGRVYIDHIYLMNHIDTSIVSKPEHGESSVTINGRHYRAGKITAVIRVPAFVSGFICNDKQQSSHSKNTMLGRKNGHQYQDEMDWQILKNGFDENSVGQLGQVSKFASITTNSAGVDKIILIGNKRPMLGRLNMLFRGIHVAEIKFKNFDTSKIWGCVRMFDQCRNLKDVNIKSLDLRRVKNAREMFRETAIRKINPGDLRFRDIEDMTRMFERSNIEQFIIEDNMSLDRLQFINYMFNECDRLKILRMCNQKLHRLKEMNYTFAGCRKLKVLNLDNLDMPGLHKMNHTFDGTEASNLKIVGIDRKDVRAKDGSSTTKTITWAWHWQTGDVRELTQTFNQSSLREVDISGISLESLEKMNFTFNENKYLKKVVLTDKPVVAESLKTMKAAFIDCHSLKEIDFTDIETPCIENINAIFKRCRNLEEIKFNSNFKTEHVVDMSEAFEECMKLRELDIRSFSLEGNPRMWMMFSNTSRYLNLICSDKWPEFKEQYDHDIRNSYLNTEDKFFSR